MEPRTSISAFRRQEAALKGWRKRRAHAIRRIEAWCLEELRLRGMI